MDISYTLFISVCFPPSVDACAITVAKRLREWGQKIDVISNKICRDEDPQLKLLTKNLVNNEKILTIPFTNLGSGLEMEEFASSCELQLEQWKTQGLYDKMYSRALWPASHIAAIVYKTHFPKTKWSADFSDPILYDIKGKQRFSPLTESWFQTYIASNLKSINDKNLDLIVPDNKNAYLWSELMTYILADELMFTNPNQLKFMVNGTLKEFRNLWGKQSIKTLKKWIMGKSKIAPHPTLPREFYNVCNTDHLQLKRKKGSKHIAYFGAFYDRRDISNLIEPIDSFKDITIYLHIFTNNPPIYLKELSKNHKRIILHEYLSYFDSLSAMTKFDAILVIDALITPVLGMNPYLPSKFSDCLGAGTPIWLITEKGSYLDKLDLATSPVFPFFSPFSSSPDKFDKFIKTSKIFRSRIGAAKQHLKILQTIRDS